MHFCVLVIAEDPEQALAPYNEFITEPEDFKYIKEFDVTKEHRERYDLTKVNRYLTPEGELIDRLDLRCYRLLTPEEQAIYDATDAYEKPRLNVQVEYRFGSPRVFDPPKDWVLMEVPIKELMTFLKFSTDYWGYPLLTKGDDPNFDTIHQSGYVEVDPETMLVLRVVDRCNPNGKWDWYVHGGRWKTTLKLKPGALALEGGFAESSTHPGKKVPAAWAAMAEDVDWQAMLSGPIETWKSDWHLARTALAEAGFPPDTTWGIPQDCPPDDRYNESWKKQPQLAVISKAFEERYGWLPATFLNSLSLPLEEFLSLLEATYCFTDYVVFQDQWKERSSGWDINYHRDEYVTWKTKLTELVTTLPVGTRVTIVDCHV